MPQYKAPLRDYQFCLHELFNYSAHSQLPGFSEFTEDVVTAVLEQAGKFAEQVIFPLNSTGDAEGCTIRGGVVTTPTGFRQAYRALCDGGWTALTCDPADGGQGMPHVVNFLFEEMMGAASLAFSLYPGLTRGAYVTIARHGSEQQRALYAPKLASGEWSGSMCLTEAHCGTDLGLLKTTATPTKDGAYSLTGTKIFISAGEHDLTIQHHLSGAGAAARCSPRAPRASASFWCRSLSWTAMATQAIAMPSLAARSNTRWAFTAARLA